MDGFAMVFGGVMAGLVAGVIAYAASGQRSWIGWVVGVSAGAFMFWKLASEDT